MSLPEYVLRTLLNSRMMNGASTAGTDNEARRSNGLPLEKYFLADINQATRFTPRNNPVRQKFQGFVNFYFNSAVPGLVSTADTRNGLSSLIKTAAVPSVEYKTDIKNQYNKKRLTFSGVEYKPVSISVYDTVDSAWLIMLMRMYAHLYTNPLAKYSVSGTETTPKIRDHKVVPDIITSGGASNSYGFNSSYSDDNHGFNIRPAAEKNFITHIDIVMYHAQRAVRYTMFNPVVTSFTVDGIDYSDSQPVMINLDISYESFSVDPIVNNWITEDDMKRFSGFNTGYWKRIREGADGQNIGENIPGGTRSEVQTANMGSLKQQNLEFLSPGDSSGNVPKNLRTKQEDNFWETFSGGSDNQ